MKNWNLIGYLSVLHLVMFHIHLVRRDSDCTVRASQISSQHSICNDHVLEPGIFDSQIKHSTTELPKSKSRRTIKIGGAAVQRIGEAQVKVVRTMTKITRRSNFKRILNQLRTHYFCQNYFNLQSKNLHPIKNTSSSKPTRIINDLICRLITVSSYFQIKPMKRDRK